MSPCDHGDRRGHLLRRARAPGRDDLDPGPPANIVQCSQVGLWLRAIFEHFGLQSFPKTSGSKGLQIYVPLNTKTGYEQTKAFAHALDLKTIIGSLLGKYGRVLGVPMGPGVVQFDASVAPYAYDPDQSRKLLAGRAPIELSTFTSDGRYVNDREIYQAMNAQLNAVGFKVSPQPMEWGRLISMMSNRSAGPFYIIGWDFGEADASKMNSFLLSTSPTAIAKDADYDRLAMAGTAEMNPATRTKIWKDAQQVIHDHYMVGAVWEAASIYGVSKKLDYTPEFGENLDLARIKIRAK